MTRTSEELGSFGFTRSELERIDAILHELRAVHPDMDPMFWEDDVFELARILNDRRERDALPEDNEQ